MDVFHAAGSGGWQHLAWAATTIGIERESQVVHHVQIVGAEELFHEIDLLNADSVLAGDAAAEFDALRQNLIAGLQHALNLIFVAFVEQQNRVDVCRHPRGTR